jgi:hypothetical protein
MFGCTFTFVFIFMIMYMYCTFFWTFSCTCLWSCSCSCSSWADRCRKGINRGSFRYFAKRVYCFAAARNAFTETAHFAEQRDSEFTRPLIWYFLFSHCPLYWIWNRHQCPLTLDLSDTKVSVSLVNNERNFSLVAGLPPTRRRKRS